MKPLDRPTHLDAYMLLKLGTDGKLYLETSSSVTEQGDLGPGFYSDLKKIQYQQTILALKEVRTHIYHIEFPL